MMQVMACHLVAPADYFSGKDGMFPYGTTDTEKGGGKIELFQEVQYRRSELRVRTVIKREGTAVLFIGTMMVSGAEKAGFKVGDTDDEYPEMDKQKQGQYGTKLRESNPEYKRSAAGGGPDMVRSKARVQQVPLLPRSVNMIL